MAEEACGEKPHPVDRAQSDPMLLRRCFKRHQVRLAAKFKFNFLGWDVVERILPDSMAFHSKRRWETAMHTARARCERWLGSSMAGVTAALRLNVNRLICKDEGCRTLFPGSPKEDT
jgi:hypothetical protein